MGKRFKAIVWNNGTVEFLHHVDNYNVCRDACWWTVSAAPREGDYIHDRYPVMQWASGSAIPATSCTEHLIIRDDAYEAKILAACLGADVVALDLAIYDRHATGYFVCPHCRGRYDYTSAFQSHLYQHKDSGAVVMLRSDDFYARNLSSRRAFLKRRKAGSSDA